MLPVSNQIALVVLDVGTEVGVSHYIQRELEVRVVVATTSVLVDNIALVNDGETVCQLRDNQEIQIAREDVAQVVAIENANMATSAIIETLIVRFITVFLLLLGLQLFNIVCKFTE